MCKLTNYKKSIPNQNQNNFKIWGILGNYIDFLLCLFTAQTVVFFDCTRQALCVCFTAAITTKDFFTFILIGEGDFHLFPSWFQHNFKITLLRVKRNIQPSFVRSCSQVLCSKEIRNLISAPLRCPLRLIKNKCFYFKTSLTCKSDEKAISFHS